MPICPKCQESKPYSAFEWRGQQYALCPDCRKREYNMLRQRQARAFNAGKEAAQGAAKRRQDNLATLTMRKQERRILVRFNRITAVDRARLAVLLKKEPKTRKTLEAIRKREELLAKYQAAYEKQQELVRAGVPPGDLLDWLDE